MLCLLQICKACEQARCHRVTGVRADGNVRQRRVTSIAAEVGRSALQPQHNPILIKRARIYRRD